MNIYQDIFFRGLDKLRRRRNIERLHQLRDSQFWGPEQLRAWQTERLNILLQVARAHSPFHGPRLRNFDRLSGPEDLAQLPVMTKTDVRAHRERIRTNHLPASRYGLAHTGGSTGEPTHFYLDRCGRDWNRASVYRSAEWAGTRLGRRAVDISGSAHDHRKASTLRKRLGDLALGHLQFPLVAPTAETYAELAREIDRHRPHSVWGYTSGVVGLAEHLERAGRINDFPFLAAVVTSSETLLKPERDTLERVFGADRIFDNYGSREMYIAAQCRAHDGYHLHADVVITEIVDDEGNPCSPGQPGRVLLTDLWNHAFPFIRYEIGDMAVAAADSECPCGVKLPKMARVEGRIPDMVVLGDRVLTPPNFAIPLSDCRGVRAFQVRQETPELLRVLVEPDEDFDEAGRARIRAMMESLVGHQARVEIVTDEPIEIPESGKRRFVVSNVSAPRPEAA